MSEQAASFKVGDFARWLGTGPVMLVRHVDAAANRAEPIVTCVWFSPDEHCHKQDFPQRELRPADPPSTAATPAPR